MKNLIISFGYKEGINKVSISASTEDIKDATDAELANLIRNTIAVLKSKESKIPVVSLT